MQYTLREFYAGGACKGRQQMWRGLGVPVLVLGMVAAATAQDTASYRNSDNPYQGDHAVTLGAPVDLHVAVAGVRFATLTVTAAQEVKAGETVRCQITLSGDSAASAKAVVTAVLLLEDKNGRGLDRLSLDTFKVKPGRTFDERQTLKVAGDSLVATSRVYVLLEVAL
jgi:hypothetical protein